MITFYTRTVILTVSVRYRSQKKDAVIINLQNGGASFDFTGNQLKFCEEIPHFI